MFKVDWAEFKSFVDSRNAGIQFVEFTKYYLLAARDNWFELECLVAKDNDTPHTEFDTSYKNDANKRLVTDTDGRIIGHSTPRFLGSFTYFTSHDDDHTDPHAVGGTEPNIASLKDHHEIGQAITKTFYQDFNTINNKTWIRDGGIEYKDALNDEITFEIVPKTTVYTSGTNTNYNLYNGYLIIPAAGDGTIDVAANDMVLVQNVPNEFGVLPAGYWNADWNFTTKVFENITAAGGGDGAYNMFGVEVDLNRFLNKIYLLGSNVRHITTDDTSQLGHNARLKTTIVTEGTDHEWWWNAWFRLYRKKTV
jgi:hypothetical protein